MKIFRKFIKKKDLIIENVNLKKQLEVEKMKSAYWILKANGQEANLICSAETADYIKRDGLIHKS